MVKGLAFLFKKRMNPQNNSNRKRVSKPPQIYSPEQPLTGSRSRDDDDEDWSSQPFARMVHTMLEETKNPEIVKWSADGDGFYLNQNHPGLSKILFKHFKREFILFHVRIIL